MSTKPTFTPRWSTDESNESAPSAGLMDTGYPLSAVPTSSVFNYLLRYLSLWCAYLDDGDVELNDVTVLSDLTVAGALSVDLTTILAGDVDAQANVAITGDLDVTGEMRCGADYAFGERIMSIPASAATPDAGTAMTFGSGVWNLETDTSTTLNYPIALNVGDRIVTWTMFLEKHTAAGAMNAALYKMNAATGVGAQVGTFVVNSDSNPGRVQLVPVGAQNFTLAANESYRLVVNQTDGSTDNYAYHLEVTYDRP